MGKLLMLAPLLTNPDAIVFHEDEAWPGRGHFSVDSAMFLCVLCGEDLFTAESAETHR